MLDVLPQVGYGNTFLPQWQPDPSFIPGPIAPIYDRVPEGLTIVIEAPQRWGKTLTLFVWANDYWQRENRVIWSNIQLGIPHQKLEFADVKLDDDENTPSKFRGGHISIDELNFYYDGRRSMSGENLQFGTFLLQQKKQGCNLTGTTHNLESLDVRIREHYDLLVRPSVYPKYPAKPEWLTMEITNGPTQEYLYKRVTIPCAQYLGWYNSFRVYDPFKGLKQKKAQRLADEIKRPTPRRRVNMYE